MSESTRCPHCGADHVPTMRPATMEQAFIHDLLYGGGMYWVPGGEYVLPVCHAS